MTIAQAEQFYASDKHKYKLNENKEFLLWLKEKCKKGYNCYIDIGELQSLIDYIVSWYEIKYPEREMSFYEGVRDTRFPSLERMSICMNVMQLLYRLPENQLSLIWSYYRAKGGYSHNNEWFASFWLRSKDKSNNKYEKFRVPINCKNGYVQQTFELPKNIQNKIGDKAITIKKLLVFLQEDGTLDYSEARQCLFDHETDMELRDKILEYAALKMIYSKTTTPDFGYERAQRFIKEFDQKLFIYIDSRELDGIHNREYPNESIRESRKNKVSKGF